MYDTNQLLRKAVMTSNASGGDVGGVGQAPVNIQQVRPFLRLAIEGQTMLNDIRTVISNAAVWQESKVSLDQRVFHRGTQATRLADNKREKVTTGMTEIRPVLLRGELPISDELLEDQVEEEGFGNTIMTLFADALGRDIEELAINGDVTSVDDDLNQLDGWIVQAQTGISIDAAGDGQDYQLIMKRLLNGLPARYKRDKANMRYYVPVNMDEIYRDQLAGRATNGGDRWLTSTDVLVYQGIQIMPIPLFPVDNADKSFIMLGHRTNFYAGFRREVRIESFRDPREGAISYTATARFDAKVGHTPAVAIATNVDVSI